MSKLDSETNLFYNYYRDYDPQLGRYVQSDPIGLTGGMNTYGYVGGNPSSFYDSLGLMGVPSGGIGAGSRPASGDWSGSPAANYAFVSYTGPAVSLTLSISQSGHGFVQFGTGDGQPGTVDGKATPSCQAGFGKLNGNNGKNSNQDVDSFLNGGSGYMSYGQYILGAGTAFSGGRTATQITIGTPSLPGGGYAVQLW